MKKDIMKAIEDEVKEYVDFAIKEKIQEDEYGNAWIKGYQSGVQYVIARILKGESYGNLSTKMP